MTNYNASYGVNALLPYCPILLCKYVYNVPAAKLPASSGTAAHSGPAEIARDQSPRRRPHTTLRSDRADERSGRPATSERSSCDCSDVAAAPFHFRRARGYPATRASDRRLPRIWHLQNSFTGFVNLHVLNKKL